MTVGNCSIWSRRAQAIVQPPERKRKRKKGGSLGVTLPVGHPIGWGGGGGKSRRSARSGPDAKLPNINRCSGVAPKSSSPNSRLIWPQSTCKNTKPSSRSAPDPDPAARLTLHYTHLSCFTGSKSQINSLINYRWVSPPPPPPIPRNPN